MNFEGRVWKYGDDVNTDVLIPARYLNTSEPAELAKHALEDLDASFVGEVRPGDIIVAGKNFGCGSSREHAPWALLDYGFRALIAPSFADIFYNNCFKNGILPVVFPEEQVADLMARLQAEPGAQVTVDLEACRVFGPGGFEATFTVDPFRRECLLKGLDDIGLTLQNAADIDAFEQRTGKVAATL